MVKIRLTKNKFAIIDDEDFDRVSSKQWSYHHTGYAVRGKPQISLHRFILGAKKGQYVDHINRNKLDNRKSNLRFCTPAQNQYNRLPAREMPKGLTWRPARNAWIVRIQADGKRYWVGYFKEFGEAKKSYLKAAKKLHGDFLRTNASIT